MRPIVIPRRTSGGFTGHYRAQPGLSGGLARRPPMRYRASRRTMARARPRETRDYMVGAEGIEPSTPGLKVCILYSSELPLVYLALCFPYIFRYTVYADAMVTFAVAW